MDHEKGIGRNILGDILMTIMTRSGARVWWKEELPKHIIYLYHDEGFSFEGKYEWKEYTYAEHNAKKKEKQESNIERKRNCLRRVPCFIHVFYNDTDWFFSGWYIVIWSVHGPGPYGMWYLNWRESYKHKEFFPRIKQHLPLDLLPFAEDVDDNTWFNNFCKTYPMQPKGIQNPRGKYLIYCIIDSYNNLIDIDLEKEKIRN